MLQRTAYSFRAYPDTEQASLFRRTAGCCRLVYNVCLEQRRLERQRSDPRRITAAGQMKELKDLKAAAPFLKEVPHHPLQQAIRDLDRAFLNFFEGRASYPKPRTKFRNESFRYPDPVQIKLDRDGQRIFLPKAGWVQVRMHREIDGVVKNVTVSRQGAWWFVSIAVEREIDEPAIRTGPSIGIDLGVTNAIATSDGQVFDLPRVGAQEQRQLAAAQKTIARCRQGSRNRQKAILRLRRLQARHARRRGDAQAQGDEPPCAGPCRHRHGGPEGPEHDGIGSRDGRRPRLDGCAKSRVEPVAARRGVRRDPPADRVQDEPVRRSPGRCSGAIHLAAVLLLRVDDSGEPINKRPVRLCLLRLCRLRGRQRRAEHAGKRSIDLLRNRRTSRDGLWIELRWKPETGTQTGNGQKLGPSGPRVVMLKDTLSREWHSAPINIPPDEIAAQAGPGGRLWQLPRTKKPDGDRSVPSVAPTN